jgi:hypothetical protein
MSLWKNHDALGAVNFKIESAQTLASSILNGYFGVEELKHNSPEEYDIYVVTKNCTI